MQRAAIALLASLSLTFVSCNRIESRNPQNPSGASSGSLNPTPPISGHIAPEGSVVSYADMVDHVAPAVVTVRSARRIHAPQQFPFMNDPFFNWLFGGQQRQGGQAPVREQRALGSGVMVREDGYILTNDHVIDGAEEINVDLIDRRSFKAKLIGEDKPSDLAVLKIDAKDLPVLSLANSDQVRVGDVCLAVGNPLGIGETVTQGIVSAKGRRTDISDGSFEDFLQTDAAINQGNSGGALVNTRGELIGIDSQILTPNGGNIGIGFAIPSNMAKTVLSQLIAHGQVSRGQLGVTVQYINSDLAASLGLNQVQGVLVNSVQPGGPADKAGIKTGDILLELNGTPLNDVNTLRNSVASAGAGNEITLKLIRNGSRQEIRVKLGEFKPQLADSEKNQGGNSGEPSGRLGLGIRPMTPNIASQLGVPPATQGVAVTSVDPNGPAAEAGIREGDVIQQINHQTVRNFDEVQTALAKSGNRPALIQMLRKGQTLFLGVPLR